jgi:hypothetical protein
MLIGKPGSGKSTLSQFLLKTEPYLHIVNVDKHILEIAKSHGITYNDVMKDRKLHVLAEKRCSEDLNNIFANGDSFIWDQTNIERDRRSSRVERLILEKYFIIGIELDIPPHILQERIKKREEDPLEKTLKSYVYRDAELNFQTILESELFNQVYLVDENMQFKSKFTKKNSEPLEKKQIIVNKKG